MTWLIQLVFITLLWKTTIAHVQEYIFQLLKHSLEPGLSAWESQLATDWATTSLYFYYPVLEINFFGWWTTGPPALKMWQSGYNSSGPKMYYRKPGLRQPGFESRWQRPICANATRFTPSVDILGCQRRVHLIPCLCGMGCKRNLALEMEDMVSVCLIIIIIVRLYIAINEVQRDVKPIQLKSTYKKTYLSRGVLWDMHMFVVLSHERAIFGCCLVSLAYTVCVNWTLKEHFIYCYFNAIISFVVIIIPVVVVL